MQKRKIAAAGKINSYSLLKNKIIQLCISFLFYIDICSLQDKIAIIF